MKISVIMPVYNGEQYLDECLDSILHQTLRDIEILCIDDGSTDGSAEVLRKRAANDPRIRLFHSSQVGAFRAREVGVKAAKGEYLYFMDADDILDVRAFEELCALADKENLDQIVFAASVFCEDDIPQSSRDWARTLVNYYSIPTKLKGKVMTGMELMGALMDADHFHVSPPLRLIRATVMKGRKYGFPDARSRADNYFTPLTLFYSRRACAVDTRYYRRRVRNGSITTASDAERRHFRNMFQVMLGLYRFEPFQEMMRDQKSCVSRFMMKLASSLNTWVWKLDPVERAELLKEALGSASPAERAQLVETFLLAIRELKRRPRPTVHSAVKFTLRRVWHRLKGDKIENWFLK